MTSKCNWFTCIDSAAMMVINDETVSLIKIYMKKLSKMKTIKKLHLFSPLWKSEYFTSISDNIDAYFPRGKVIIHKAIDQNEDVVDLKSCNLVNYNIDCDRSLNTVFRINDMYELVYSYIHVTEDIPIILITQLRISRYGILNDYYTERKVFFTDCEYYLSTKGRISCCPYFDSGSLDDEINTQHMKVGEYAQEFTNGCGTCYECNTSKCIHAFLMEDEQVHDYYCMDLHNLSIPRLFDKESEMKGNDNG